MHIEKEDESENMIILKEFELWYCVILYTT